MFKNVDFITNFAGREEETNPSSSTFFSFELVFVEVIFIHNLWLVVGTLRFLFFRGVIENIS